MDIREKFAITLHQLVQLGGEIGWPMVIAVQNQLERNDAFPGILMLQMPNHTDSAMVLAAMILKDGIEEGLGKIIPGLKVKAVDMGVYEHKLAEAEQGDNDVKGFKVEIPNQYLSLNGRVITNE